MDLQELEYFVTIAESGNLSKAATKLNVSQPTLSLYLARAEKQAGAILLTRSKNREMALTAAGEAYLECCRENLSNWNRTKQDIQTLRQGEPQVITVAMASPSGALKLFRIFSGLREKYPDHRLARYSYLIPGQEKMKLPITEVGDDPMVLMNTNTIFGASEAAWFKKQRFTPNVAVYVTHLDMVRLFVTKLGYVGLTSFRPNPGEDVENISVVAVEDPFYARSGVIYRRDLHFSPILREMVEEFICDSRHGYDEYASGNEFYK